MDYRKLDPGLATALEAAADADEEVTVLVRTRAPLDANAEALMQRFGIGNAPVGRTVFTATLARDMVQTLSDQDWVQSLSLSRQRTLKKR
jgi:hypothetical protein